MQLNHRESATVLAALRFWQRNVIGCQHPYLLTTRIPDELRGHFDESSPLAENEVDTVCERLNSDRCEDEVTETRCSVCRRWCNAAKVHVHQGAYVGDECCWDERLRASE